MEHVKKSKLSLFDSIRRIRRGISTRAHWILYILLAVSLVVATGVLNYQQNRMQLAEQENSVRDTQIMELSQQLASASATLEALQNEDQVKKNVALQEELVQMKRIYAQAVTVYEDIVDLKQSGTKTTEIDALFAQALSYLSKEDVASATQSLTKVSDAIKKLTVVAVKIPAQVTQSNEAPSSGFRRQAVNIDGTQFLVDIVAADLNSTRIIVDTASDSTCTQDCPVLSLADYVSRSGAYAGINGTYFCPESYPSCQDKKNVFDVLVMNKNKVYFNSDNNVYSTVPVFVSLGNSVRILSKSQDWGRDTGVDAVIANRPLLVENNQSMFSGNDDAKESSRSNRSFIGGHDNLVYIGVVHSATVAESAKVLQTLGIGSAINLDSGGSTALWSGGYKAGPGRNIPNAVLFVRK